MKPTSLSRSRFTRGFSLPEATLAIAISALGLTTLLGFVPQGLKTLKAAGDVATETRITQQILSSVNQAQWEDAKGKDLLADSYHLKRFYYDDLAVEVDSKDPMLTYVAEVSVPEADIHLPANASSARSSSADPDQFLRRVTVNITNVSDPEFNFKEAKNTSYSTYASLVSRNGR